MTPCEAPYQIESGEGHSRLVLLPTVNDGQWADIEKVGTEVLHWLQSQNAPAVAVDLSQMDYIGSATVALIVRIWKGIKEREGRMVVVNQHEVVNEVLNLAGLTKIWTVVDSHEKALDELRVASGKPVGKAVLMLAVVGIVAVVGAALGLFLHWNKHYNIEPRVAQGIIFGFSALGLIVGSICSVRAAGGRRAVGITVVLASLSILVAGILHSTP